jgi:hypothetical protein
MNVEVKRIIFSSITWIFILILSVFLSSKTSTIEDKQTKSGLITIITTTSIFIEKGIYSLVSLFFLDR